MSLIWSWAKISSISRCSIENIFHNWSRVNRCFPTAWGRQQTFSNIFKIYLKTTSLRKLLIHGNIGLMFLDALVHVTHPLGWDDKIIWFGDSVWWHCHQLVTLSPIRILQYKLSQLEYLSTPFPAGSFPHPHARKCKHGRVLLPYLGQQQGWGVFNKMPNLWRH